MITELLREDGERWMEYDEQMRVFPLTFHGRHHDARPVWLVLSLGLRDQGIEFRNGLGVSGQMRSMRDAYARHFEAR